MRTYVIPAQHSYHVFNHKSVTSKSLISHYIDFHREDFSHKNTCTVQCTVIVLYIINGKVKLKTMTFNSLWKIIDVYTLRCLNF